MCRWQALGNLLQAAVYAGLAAWLQARWGPAAALAGAGALAQLAAGALVLGGRPVAVRALSALTALLGAGLAGAFVQAAVHALTAYGADATRHGQLALAAIALVLPWVLVFPTWQALAGRGPGGGARALGMLLGVGLAAGAPSVARALHAGPVQTWPEQPQLAAAAEAAWTRWTGGEAALPAGAGPAVVLLTAWADGAPQATTRGEGPDLGAAIEQALGALPAPADRPALVLDVARARHAADALVPAGAGSLSARGGRSPAGLVQAEGVDHRELLPQWRVPVPAAAEGEAPTRFDSALASAAGAVPLVSGWAEGPRLDADEALDAAVAGGDYLLQHQGADGRYAYIIQGPSGRPGAGYNYPRHAGVTWFLTRLAARTGEARFVDGAARGFAFLRQATVTGADGRAWVTDPRRKDGRAWAGTTALAAMAAATHPQPVPEAAAWGALLASVVDADGAVRGEVDVATGAVLPDQPMNPYGQGQVTLALALLVRAGHEELRPALVRAARFLDGGYAPGGAGRLVVLDEHWTCIAALAVQEVLGTPHGLGVCRGYLAESASRTPIPGSALAIATGPGGGLAEAVVAAAVLDPAGPHHERALAFGQHFLDAQYRAADAPLLPRPRALLGAFRDRPWELDVQMDAVQHIGCALLGIEELLRGARLLGARP